MDVNIIVIGVVVCFVVGGLICYVTEKARTGVLLLCIGILGLVVVVNYCQSPDITLIREYEEIRNNENYVVDAESCYVIQKSDSVVLGDKNESYEIELDKRTSVRYHFNSGDSDNACATVRNYLRVYETHWRFVKGKTKVDERQVALYLPKSAKIEYLGEYVFEARS